MLADHIDVSPLVERSDELVSKCLEKALRAGVDKGEADALHTWVLRRLRVRDPVVERALTALLNRDAGWGAANYEQEVFDRYSWELAAEMAGEPRDPEGLWTYSVGSFESCGATFEVLLHRPDDRCPGSPHMHVRMECPPRVPHVLIGLYEAVYLPFGHRRWELDRRRREDLADFLESLRFPGESWPLWGHVAQTWRYACEEDGTGEVRDLDFESMPDYRTLWWPDGEEDPA